VDKIDFDRERVLFLTVIERAIHTDFPFVGKLAELDSLYLRRTLRKRLKP